MEELVLTKEQVKEFAIYIDLTDIRKFIQDNQEEYNIFEKLENQCFIYRTCKMLYKIKMKKTFEILEIRKELKNGR